jgi:DNA helicase-2/ATP-dependent DNA helicase PcrA
MTTNRSAAGYPEVVAWQADTEADEAARITQLVNDIHHRGVRFRDIVVLVRTGAAYKQLVDHFAKGGIPVQPGGRTGLFDQPEAVVLGKAVVWLTDLEWRKRYQDGVPVTDKDLFTEIAQVFELDRLARTNTVKALRRWKTEALNTSRPADLVGELYRLLQVLDVASWDLNSPIQVNRIGTLARFSTLLADYESVPRRARPDARAGGEQVGGRDRGKHYYRNLGIHIVNYAVGEYEGFDGEPDFALDAVDLTTVHRAKGLEWPVVFVPSLTIRRFPSERAGRRQEWLVPRTAFNATRYEGSDPDERRLFYVAITRARDWLSLSRHDRVARNRVDPSPYWEAHHDLATDPAEIDLPSDPATAPPHDDPVTVTYSDMALFLDCARAYRLRSLIGFQPRLAPELGYGKAVHHVLRRVAEMARKTGDVPLPADIADLLDADFFLPSANKIAHRQMKEAAHRLVTEYTTTHPDDLFRIWETERPFELHLDGVTISGRADVILDKEASVDTALAILDYKTSTTPLSENKLQLQVYTDAGRREGLDVRGAYVHDLKAGRRSSVAIDPRSIKAAERTVSHAARRLRALDFSPNPGPRCQTCEVRAICDAAPQNSRHRQRP